MLVEKADEEGVCKHYWLIEIASGTLSKGVCRKCGLSDKFETSLPPQTTFYRNYIRTRFGKRDEETVEEDTEKIESLEVIEDE